MYFDFVYDWVWTQEKKPTASREQNEPCGYADSSEGEKPEEESQPKVRTRFFPHVSTPSQPTTIIELVKSLVSFLRKLVCKSKVWSPTRVYDPG